MAFAVEVFTGADRRFARGNPTSGAWQQARPEYPILA